MSKKNKKKRGRPRKYKSATVVSVNLSDEVAEWCRAEANRCGLSWSEFIATLIHRAHAHSQTNATS